MASMVCGRLSQQYMYIGLREDSWLETINICLRISASSRLTSLEHSLPFHDALLIWFSAHSSLAIEDVDICLSLSMWPIEPLTNQFFGRRLFQWPSLPPPCFPSLPLSLFLSFSFLSCTFCYSAAISYRSHHASIIPRFLLIMVVEIE